MPRGNLGLPSVTTPTGAAMLHLLPVVKSLLMSSRCHFARPELKHCNGAEPNSHGLEAAIMMHKASQSVLRVSRACEQGLWQRSAMAMATKVDGGKNSAGGIDQGSPGANSAEREAFRDDMDNSYGDAYSTRSSDEGYGERYGEAVKVVLEKKHDTAELQRGASGERDQNEETVVNVQYDTSQGEHVEEKEVSRHSTKGSSSAAT